MHDYCIKIRRSLTALLAVGFLAVSGWTAEARGLTAQEGIGNFGKISDGLYRGAQPGAAGIKNLERLGIKTIINLRMPNDVWKSEAAEARAHGILYTNVPLRGLARPTDDQVQTVLGLIETLPGPVFIHCQHGCDRTGTIVACYRIKHDQWQCAKALNEAVLYGLSRIERGMRKFVVDFGKALPANKSSNKVAGL